MTTPTPSPADTPAPNLLAHAPVLMCKDVQAAVDFWRDKVGFGNIRTFFGPPPSFAILDRDGLSIMLALLDDPEALRTYQPHWKLRDMTAQCYFWVSDAKALYHELKLRGAPIDFELCDQPWGCREFGIQDLEHHDIVFGQDLASDA
ncbi:MAG: VOC family protein [Planctomycetota bacterium]